MLQIFMSLKESFALVLSCKTKNARGTYQDKHHKVATAMDKRLTKYSDSKRFRKLTEQSSTKIQPTLHKSHG
jgi:hypothetical protein